MNDSEKEWFKTEPFQSFWEKGYKDMNVSTMGGPNHDIVELSNGLPENAKVLDLGCGEGRNSFYLASKGCRVTAVDRSSAGIEKLAELARRANYNITGVVEDIREFKIDEPYDLIMAHGVIDYLENEEWHLLLNKIKEMTTPGGYNAYTCMLFGEEYPAPPEFRVAHFKHSVSPYELGDVYQDWNIVRYDYYVKWDQHPGLGTHRHPLEKITARKPGGTRRQPKIEKVPVTSYALDRKKFDAIAMGTSHSELLSTCGEPDVIDTYSIEGMQLGVSSNITLNDSSLSLWYYGDSVFYVINETVWGRSLYLRNAPVRVHYQ